MTTMTTQRQFNDALETVSLILLGRRTALKTNGVRGDAVAVLDIAEEAHKGDLTNLDARDPEFQSKAKQATRKLEAIQSLRVLSNVIDEFDWEH